MYRCRDTHIGKPRNPIKHKLETIIYKQKTYMEKNKRKKQPKTV